MPSQGARPISAPSCSFISAPSLPTGHRISSPAQSDSAPNGRRWLGPRPPRIARSFFVDLVQSTFAATYRTGVWPRRFRSFVGRELAARIAKRRLAEGEEPSDALALRLLDGTARWEDEGVGFEKVTAEVNELLGEADDFAIVTMEELLHVDQDGRRRYR